MEWKDEEGNVLGLAHEICNNYGFSEEFYFSGGELDTSNCPWTFGAESYWDEDTNTWTVTATRYLEHYYEISANEYLTVWGGWKSGTGEDLRAGAPESMVYCWGCEGCECEAW